MKWVGPRFWGNRLQDWHIVGEQIESRPLFWHFPVYLQAYDQNGEEPETHDPHYRNY